MGTPRSPIDLKTTVGVSTWISTCSPVGADCTMSLQFRGFPSAWTAKVPARRPRRSFGSSPQRTLSDTIAASAACRSIGGSSAHTSARRRDPPAACIRRGIHTPSTSCRTLTSVGLHSMSTVEARELTAIWRIFFASSIPSVARARSRRPLLSSLDLPPAAWKVSGGRASTGSTSASILTPNWAIKREKRRRMCPPVSTLSDLPTLALCCEL